MAREKLRQNEVTQLPDRILPVNEEMFRWIVGRELRQKINAEIVAGTPSKTLILNDLHAPETDWAAVQKCLDAHGDAKNIILNGDTLQCDSVSNHSNEYEEVLRNTLGQVVEFIAELKRKKKKIFVSLGNHENWYARLLLEAQTMNPKLKHSIEALLFLLGAEDRKVKSLTDMLADNTKIQGGYGWVMQAGEAVIAHPSCFSSTAGKTVQWTGDFLDNWSWELGLSHWTTLFIGHTHQAVNDIVKNKHLIEGLCLSHPQDYNFSGRIKACNRNNRWHKGCSYLTLEKGGKVNHNESGWWLAEPLM